MTTAADVLARQEIARLDERINAARRLLLTDGSVTAAERERFANYIQKLLERRTELEAAQGESSDDDNMTEARVNNVEATLRLMDDRLTRIVEQIHQLDMRTGRLEDSVISLKDAHKTTSDQVRGLSEQLRNQDGPVGYSRMYLAGGALAMTVVIFLLVMLTWRLL